MADMAGPDARPMPAAAVPKAPASTARSTISWPPPRLIRWSYYRNTRSASPLRRDRASTASRHGAEWQRSQQAIRRRERRQPSKGEVRSWPSISRSMEPATARRPSRIRRCSTCCATIWRSTAPSSAAGWRNAAPARCWSTARRCAPASPPIGALGNAEITTIEGLGTRRQAASAAEGVHRRAGRAVRLLHQRHDHDGEGTAGPQAASDRGRRARRRWPAISAAAEPTTGSSRAVMRAGQAMGRT